MQQSTLVLLRHHSLALDCIYCMQLIRLMLRWVLCDCSQGGRCYRWSCFGPRASCAMATAIANKVCNNSARNEQIGTGVCRVQNRVAAAVFFTRSGFFSFIWGSGAIIENLVFFWLWSNFRNICCITVFSIPEYSSFTGAMCWVNSQYRWAGLGLIKLFEI